jgi:hypothetical protein
MRRRFIAALGVSGLWVCGVVAVFAQSGRSPFEGAWEVRDITVAPGGRAVNKPVGMVIFSGNRYSITFVTDSARPGVPLPVSKSTADQLLASWGPLTASAGTFQVSGSALTIRPTVAKNTDSMTSAAFVEYTVALKGDMLILATIRNHNGAAPNPQTLHLVRAK